MPVEMRETGFILENIKAQIRNNDVFMKAFVGGVQLRLKNIIRYLLQPDIGKIIAGF